MVSIWFFEGLHVGWEGLHRHKMHADRIALCSLFVEPVKRMLLKVANKKPGTESEPGLYNEHFLFFTPRFWWSGY
ncbi:hypothetical protein NC99_30710 [Sunxiuqinia dokdonensis]|uniref:Uncharacterized protein n=1 Tax=Sunxiuqinia dokdonensis TaxID=1409788 RepID=A0A0L8V6S9_9BACT|nr:hypothetical protein NC99_30710 [Sunxiuqinia dokdonensis]